MRRAALASLLAFGAVLFSARRAEKEMVRPPIAGAGPNLPRGPGSEVKITPGKRAFAFRINDVSGIAGLIQPNSRVDILVVMNGGGEKGNVAKPFMENMRVLMMQTSTARSEDGRPIPATVATLEVTPEESERLAVAQAQGTIQLVLRGYGDPDSVKTRGATAADVERSLRDLAPAPVSPRRGVASQPRAVPETVLVRDPAQPKIVPPKPDTSRVEVFRGATKTATGMPALRSARTASKRLLIAEVRGSSARANDSSSVVMLK